MQDRTPLTFTPHAESGGEADASRTCFYAIEVLSEGRWRKFIYDPKAGDVQGEFFAHLGKAKTLESAVLLIKINLFEQVAETRITSPSQGLVRPEPDGTGSEHPAGHRVPWKGCPGCGPEGADRHLGSRRSTRSPIGR